jgi:hypothetical protein
MHNISPYFYQIYLPHPGISMSAITKSPVSKAPALPFDELSYPANPVLEFRFVLHPYQTGYDHGVVHADGDIRCL